MSEKRQNLRQKSFFRGVAYFDNSPCATECVVRDISETGARLKFSVQPIAPFENLELQIPLKGVSYKCKVKWQKGDEVGVAIVCDDASNGEEASISSRMKRLEAEIAELRQIIRRLEKISGSSRVA